MLHTHHFKSFLDVFQKLQLCFRLLQLSYDSGSYLNPIVFQRIEIKRRFLIRMSTQQSFYNSRLFEIRQNCFDAYFGLFMQFAYLSTKWTCPLQSTEHPLTFLFRLKYTNILQTDFLRNFEVHPTRRIIQIGMSRINSNIVPDSFQDTTFHIISPRNRFISFENKRMM